MTHREDRGWITEVLLSQAGYEGVTPLPKGEIAWPSGVGLVTYQSMVYTTTQDGQARHHRDAAP